MDEMARAKEEDGRNAEEASELKRHKWYLVFGLV